MKLTEIYKLPKVDHEGSAAERAFDAWLDDNPWELEMAREKFSKYKTTQREDAVNYIFKQAVDFIDVGDSTADIDMDKVKTLLRKHIADALG